jgi:hypothetical protein
MIYSASWKEKELLTEEKLLIGGTVYYCSSKKQ